MRGSLDRLCNSLICWTVWLVLVGSTTACGLGDVGPDLAKWRAEHGDSTGHDAVLVDTSGSDASVDTVGSDGSPDADIGAVDSDAAGDADGDAVGGCNSPDDCPKPGECQIAICEAHVCGTKALECPADGNPCDQELCVAGQCGHSPLDGTICDDGSACTGPDTCKGGSCIGASLLGTQKLGNALFFGLIQPVPGHTLAWSPTSIVDLDGVWPSWALSEDASITAAAPLNDTELVVFLESHGDVPAAKVLRLAPAKPAPQALPAGLLPPGTQHCNSARRLPDQRIVALCSGKAPDGKGFAMAVLLGLTGEAPRWIPVSDVPQQPWTSELVGGEVWYPLAIPDAAQLARVDLQKGSATVVTYAQTQLSLITALAARPGGPVLAMGQKFAAGKGTGTAALLDPTGLVLKQPENVGLQPYMVLAALWQGGNWLTEGMTVQGGSLRRHEVLGPNLESLQAVVHAPDDLATAIAPDGKGNFWLVGGKESEPSGGTVWRIAVTGETTCDPVACVSKPTSCVASGCQVAWCSSSGCQTQTQVDGPCDDGAPCTFAKTCSGGACVGGSANSCNDALPCTLDSCDPAQGCVHSPAKPGSPCDDGDICFGGDVCSATGSCVPGTQPLACPAPGQCQVGICTPFLGCGLADKVPGAACNSGVGVCAQNQCWEPFAAALAAGPSHSCALRPDHSLWCWGSNGDGQLLATGLASTPTATQVGTGSYAQVAVGDGFTCAVDTTLGVWCWGRNDHGQTGAALGNTPAPSLVTLPIEATQLVAGTAHACAGGMDKAGVARTYCWGAAGQGQLGQGSGAVDSAVPQEVPGLSGVTALASGPSTTCGIVAGKVFCWGSAATTWVGGKGVPKPGAPNLVDLPGIYQQIWVGVGVACAAAGGGQPAVCWGMGDNPLLGSPAAAAFAVKPLGPSAPYTDVAAGGNHLCALRGDTGQVWCRTSNAAAADFGNPSGDGSQPIAIFNDLAVVELASAGNQVCARMADGSLRCLGTGALGGAVIPGTQGKAIAP